MEKGRSPGLGQRWAAKLRKSEDLGRVALSGTATTPAAGYRSSGPHTVPGGETVLQPKGWN